jgi:hypothetical protein
MYTVSVEFTIKTEHLQDYVPLTRSAYIGCLIVKAPRISPSL